MPCSQMPYFPSAVRHVSPGSKGGRGLTVYEDGREGVDAVGDYEAGGVEGPHWPRWGG